MTKFDTIQAAGKTIKVARDSKHVFDAYRQKCLDQISYDEYCTVAWAYLKTHQTAAVPGWVGDKYRGHSSTRGCNYTSAIIEAELNNMSLEAYLTWPRK
jgi:hypothetical protein